MARLKKELDFTSLIESWDRDGGARQQSASLRGPGRLSAVSTDDIQKNWLEQQAEEALKLEEEQKKLNESGFVSRLVRQRGLNERKKEVYQNADGTDSKIYQAALEKAENDKNAELKRQLLESKYDMLGGGAARIASKISDKYGDNDTLEGLQKQITQAKEAEYYQEREDAYNKLSEDDKNILSQIARENIKTGNEVHDPGTYGGGASVKDRKEAAKERAQTRQQIQDMKQGLEEKGYDVDYLLEYAERMEGEKKAEEKKAQMKEMAKEMPVGATMTTLVSGFLSPFDNAELVGRNIRNAVTGDYTPIDPNKMRFSQATDTLREGVKEKIDNPVGEFLYDTGTSMADFVTAAPFGSAGMAMMGARATASGGRQAAEEGKSAQQALLTGMAQGVAEALFEKFSLDNLVKMSNSKALKDVAKNALKQAGVEGSEEAATEMANYVTDQIINGDMSQRDETIQAYIEQGMSEEDAKKQANKELAKQIGLAFAGGALSGGIMGSAVSGMDYAVNREYYKTKQQEESQAAEQNNVDQEVNPEPVLERQENMPEADLQERLLQNAERMMDLQKEKTLTGTTGGSPAAEQNVQAEEQQKKSQDLKDNFQQANDVINETIHETEEVEQTPELTGAMEATRRGLVQQKESEEISDSIAQPESALRSTAMRAEYGQNIAKTENVTTSSTDPQSTENKPYKRNDRAYVNGQTMVVKGLEKKEGEAYAVVETQAGYQRIPMEEVSLADAGLEQVYEQAATYGSSGSKNVIYNYSQGTNPETYLRGYNAYYNAALVKLPMERVNSVYGQMLPEQVRKEAYMAGENDRNMQRPSNMKSVETQKREGGLQINESADKVSEDMRTVLDAYGKATGTTIILEETIEDGKANGYYDGDGNIHIALDSDNPFTVVLNHELTHYIQDNSDLYQEYKDFVMQKLMERDGKTMDQLVQDVIDRYETIGRTITKDEAMDEIVADAAEMFLTNESVIKELVKENKTLAEKIKGFFTDIVKKLQKMLKDYNPRSEAAVLLNEELETAKKAETLWIRALEDAAGKITSNDNVRYQFNEFGLEEYTEREKTWWKDNSKIVLANTKQDIMDFVKNHIEKRGDFKKLYIGKVGSDLAERILRDTGVNVENYNIVLKSNFENKHADKKKEELRGQIAITPDLVACIPEIIAEYESVSHSGKTLEGKPALKFEKNINGKKVVIEYVSDKRKELSTQTMYGWAEKKNPTTTPGVHAPDQTSETKSGPGPSNNSIPSTEKKNNDKKLFSLKESGKTNEDLIRENHKQKEMIQLLQKRLDMITNVEPDYTAIKKVAADILDKYQSRYKKSDLITNLENIWNYIANSPHVDGQEVVDITTGLAKEILEQSNKLNTDMAEMYSDMRSLIRKTKIKVSDEAVSEVDYAEGWNDFRKRNMGSLNLSRKEGISIDSQYQELCMLYPEMFSEDITNEGEQLMAISDAMQMTKPYYENVYGMNMEEAARDLAYEIYESYFDIKQVKSKREARAYNELQKAKDVYNEKRKQIREEIKQEYDQKLKFYQRQYKNEKQMNDKKLVEALSKQKAKYADVQKQRKESTRTTKLRQKIKKDGMTLSKWLISPTDKVHVPEPFKKSLLEFLTMTDFTNARAKIDSKNSLSLQQTMTELERQLRNMDAAQNGKDFYDGFDMDIDPDAIATISELIERNKAARSLSDMDYRSLKELDEVITSIKQSIMRMNEFYANESHKKISDAAEGTIHYLEGKKDIKYDNKLSRFFNLDMVDAGSWFRMMGPEGYTIYEEIRKGFDKRVWDIKEAQEYMDGVMKDISKKEIANISGKNAEVLSFKFGQRELRFTRAQIMSLYCLMDRPQAREHILKGGIRIDEFQTKGKHRFLKVKQNPVHLNELQAREIVDKLTPKEKELAKKMQKFLAENCSVWGNETSMQMYGYKKFNDKNYFPIKTDKTQIKTNDKTIDTASLYAIRNQGMTKSVVKGANNTIVISDIFDTFTEHVSNMASYHGYAAPLSDAMRWVNYMNLNENGDFIERKGVKTELRRVYGDKAISYFNSLMLDLNGRSSGKMDAEITSVLMGNAKAAAVGANLRVVVQQPTSIIRAAAIMDPKYLLNAVPSKTAVKKAKEHSAIALWKSWGYYETYIGKSMKEVITGQQDTIDAAKDKMMSLAGAADEITWGALWNACEAETKDKHRDLRLGSEEYYQAVAKRFDEIIDKTQVVDTTLHRSQFMRYKGIAQFQSAFMSEPTKIYNLMRNSAVDMVEKKPGAKTDMVRTSIVYALSALLTAAAAGTVDAMRDDDEYKTYLEKYVESFKENAISNLNPINQIPLGSDVMSMLGGYSASRLDMQGLNYLIQGVLTLQNDKKNNWEKAYALFRGLSSMTGIPVANIMREIQSFAQTFVGIRLTSPSENSSGYAVIKTAIEAGETAEAQETINQLLKNNMDNGKEAKEVRTSIKSSLTRAYKEEYLSGNTDIADSLKRLKVDGEYIYTEEDFERWEESQEDK